MEDKNIQFDLLENGLDFILSSVKLVKEGKLDADFKYSILHLSAGVELILKERLRKEDWRLIFNNIEHSSEASLKSGDFVSVGLEKALERLEEIDVQIDQDDTKLIKDLKKRRNKVEHFQFQETELSVKSILSKTLNFTFKFIKAELNDSIDSDLVKEQLDAIWNYLSKFKEFIEVRRSEIEPRIEGLSKDTLVIDCPYCYQKYLTLSPWHNNEHECLFCLQTNDPENLAFDYVENIQGFSKYFSIKDGEEFPLFQCPECEMETFVQESEHYLCFNCCSITSGERIDDCGQCGKKFYSDPEGVPMCPECWDYKLSSWEKL